MKTFRKGMLDIRTENMSLYTINRSLNNNKTTGLRMIIDNHHINDIVLTPIDMALFVRKVAKGYPLKPIIAFQSIEGVLRIFLTPELKSMLDYLNEKFAIDGFAFSELTDGGSVESVEFEVCIVKPSDISKFDFAVYNS